MPACPMRDNPSGRIGIGLSVVVGTNGSGRIHEPSERIMSSSADSDLITKLALELIHEASQLQLEDANEAQTRQRLIDEVLYGVLGWRRDEVTVERRVSEDGSDNFIDYICSTAQLSMLVEAKRINVKFDSLPNTRKALLKGTWVKGNTKKAIIQARDYARQKGVAFCAVTNGGSWIVFPVNRHDLVSFEDSACIIFQNADVALRKDFEEFLNTLARSSVIDGSLQRALLGSEINQSDSRRLNEIYDRSFSNISRVSVFSHIEQPLVTAFSEELIADNPEILERAYVTTPDRVRFDERIQMYVHKRDQVLNRRPLRPIAKGDIPEVARRLSSFKVSSRPVAILTLGLVGAGKTTFLNFASKVSAKEFFSYDPSKPTAHWIYTDFRSYTQDRSPRSHIISAIFSYITNHDFLKDYDKCLRHAYEVDIKNIRTGPLALFSADQNKINEAIANILLRDYENKEPYVSKIISYATKHSPVFFVIDNVDQIDDPLSQASIFLESLSLARALGANLVLAMRDATYLKNRSSPVFDAFDFDAIYIDPPDIQAVLSKRFTIAKQLMEGQTFEFNSDSGARIVIENAGQVVDLLSQGVLGTNVGRLIEVAATGDTRLALRMTRQFLQYGYSSSGRALEIFQRTGRYSLPPHEALRAIMFGNQSIYNDNYSAIGNPFDAKLGRSEAQFLRIYIMSALVSSATNRGFSGLEVAEIINNLEKIGFSSKITDGVLRDLISHRYIFSKSHQEFSRDSIVFPSRLAGYVVRELIGTFIFMETVQFDTFIADDGVWSTMRETMKLIYAERDRAKKFRLRKSAVFMFYEFLEKEVQRLVDIAQLRGLTAVWCINPLSRSRQRFEQDMQRALTSAQRNSDPTTVQ